jgi:hypothetical protein
LHAEGLLFSSRLESLYSLSSGSLSTRLPELFCSTTRTSPPPDLRSPNPSDRASPGNTLSDLDGGQREGWQHGKNRAFSE